MANRVIKLPNGTLGVFNTCDRSMIYWNASREEMIVVLIDDLEFGRITANLKCDEAEADYHGIFAPEGWKSHNLVHRFRECMKDMKLQHGAEEVHRFVTEELFTRVPDSASEYGEFTCNNCSQSFDVDPCLEENLILVANELMPICPYCMPLSYESSEHQVIIDGRQDLKG